MAFGQKAFLEPFLFGFPRQGGLRISNGRRFFGQEKALWCIDVHILETSKGYGEEEG